VGNVQVIDRSTPAEAMVNLDGTPKANEIWQITLDDGATTPAVLSYKVLAGDTLATIATKLAAAVNLASNYALGVNPGYVAVAEGDSVVIVRRDGTAFAATPHIQPAGQPTAAGEQWTVTLQSATSAALAGLAPNTPLTFTYTTVAGDTEASIARALAQMINNPALPEFRASSDGEVLRIENIAGNVFTTTFASNGTPRPNDVEAASALVSTRVDGINYYELETLNLTLGSGNDVFNVQGTTATTNLDLGAGDDALYVSSTAAFGLPASATATPPTFLTGNLRDINGALNIDAGTGANQLMISNEASTLDNPDIVISDVLVAGEPANAEIAIRGLTGGTNAYGWFDPAQATITYRAAPTAPTPGNFGGGVTIWTGFGKDTIWVDGAADRAGVRTITTLNTGLGDDTVGVNLTAGQDGVFVLNTQGPWNNYPASAYPGISDNDIVLGAGTNPANGPAGAYESTAGLIVFGGQGDDQITGGAGDDVLFGDRGQAVSYEYVGGVPTANVVEVLGGGGPGDFTNGVPRNIDQFSSTYLLVGGNDTIIGLEGDNLVVGGAGADTITVGSGADVVLGDNGLFGYTTNGLGAPVLTQARTTDTLDQPTWDDVIVTGAGNNVVLAGMGDDHVNDPLVSPTATPSAGTDIVIGDNGYFTWDSAGNPVSFGSTNAGQTIFTPGAGAGNPFGGIVISNQSAPSLADIDGDGDLDAVLGGSDGTLRYFENTGTAALPAYTERFGAANPFNGIDVGTDSTPSFADVNGDGTLDLVVGAADGTLSYYQNTGTATAPVYVQQTSAANPFNGIDVGTESAPSFADVNGDGKPDLLVGAADGTLSYYQNTGTATVPVYVQQSGAGSNPFNGIVVGTESAPSFADVNGDGKLDLLVGAADGTLSYFRNTGTATAPVYVQQSGAANPFNGIDVGTESAPGFADVNGDGKLDLVVGAADGTLRSYANTGTPAAPVYAALAGTANPFNVVDIGQPTSFADVDSDGDLDVVMGGSDGTLRYFENTGSSAAPLYVERTGAANPFAGIDVGSQSTPSLADLDHDGDLDLVVGGDSGTLAYYQNTGTGAAPAYTAVTGAANPFNGIGVVIAPALPNTQSTPVFADLDGDGDLDLVLGQSDGTLAYYKNTGSDTAPAYVQLTGIANPFAGVGVGIPSTTLNPIIQSTPAFADVDGDGDLDMVLGQSNGTLKFYENTGTGAAPVYVERAGAPANPFNGIDVGDQSTPSFVDLDGDGDMDLVVGASNGAVQYYVNNSTGAGGNDVIVVGDGANIVVGGFGNDTISTGKDADIILGDNGAAIYTLNGTTGAAQLLQAQSTGVIPGVSSNDTIIATQGLPGEAGDLIIAGVGTDTVIAGSGTDMIIGDNGQINWAAGGELSQVMTTNPALGAGDNIQAGDGDNIVAGGAGADVIVGGANEDLILGDNGLFDFTTNGGVAILTSAQTTDVVDQPTWGDTIVTGGGQNIVLAGMGSDVVNDPTAVIPPTLVPPGFVTVPSAGVDIVIGDNGQVAWDVNGLIESFQSTQPTFGGNDVIDVGDGQNIVVGGFGDDTITTGLDADIVLGDNGQVTYTPGTTQLLQAVSTDATNATGGDDTINAGEGNNLIMAGVGDDIVTAGAGDDLVLGDNGQIDWTPTGVYDSFQTTDPTLGGNDDIRVGDGNNIVAGGFGADVIETGVGTDLIIGDNGLFDFTTNGAGVAILTEAVTTDTTNATGGDDVIVSGGGTTTNIVLAGVGADLVNVQGPNPTDPAPAVSAGQDIVIGDNGSVTWDAGGLLTAFGSTDPQLGGNDVIDVGDGQNIVVGGFGDDMITTGAGADIVLGDDGQVDYVTTDGNSADIDSITSTSTTAFGGADTIVTGGGDDIVIGGRFDDTIDAGDGDNLVIGDSGLIVADTVDAPQMAGQPITLGLVLSTQIDDGGNDTITTGTGNDIVVGGFGGDTVTSGAGNDIVFGDNGLIAYTGAVPTLIETTDTVAATGGDDTIDAGDGNNVVMGGVGADTITTGSGADVVMGDNGAVTYDTSGNVVQATTFDPVLGGNDTISTGDGNDVAMGGVGNDTVTSAGGSDILFGDGGSVTFGAGTNVLIVSVDPAFGGDDTLDGGAGQDILIGGAGLDLLYGNLTEDLLFGGNAAITLANGKVTSIETDVNDLVSDALFKSFQPGEGDKLPPLVLGALLGPFSLLGQDPLLQRDVFQKLFDSEAVPSQETPSHYEGVEQNQGTPQDAVPPGGGNDSTDQPAGEQGRIDDQATVLLAASPAQAQEEAAPAAAQPAPAGATASEGGDLLVAAMGFAGLHVVQPAPSRGRKAFDWNAILRLARKAFASIARL
jgi:Ca2+-binding RTX toxin-like protein